MISEERIAELTHQAENKGLSEAQLKSYITRGGKVKDLQHGAMITVTPVEVKELLASYLQNKQE